MITKEQATALPVGQTLYHATARNYDGSALRARVNGACKTWARRPDEWRLPLKHGLKNCFYVYDYTATDWLAFDPVELAKIKRGYGLADDTPWCIVRDRLTDDGRQHEANALARAFSPPAPPPAEPEPEKAPAPRYRIELRRPGTDEWYNATPRGRTFTGRAAAERRAHQMGLTGYGCRIVEYTPARRRARTTA